MTDTTEDPILVEDVGNVRILTLNRPRVLNAISRALGWRLIDEFDRAEADPAVRVIVLTGSGDRAFSAGGDLVERVSDAETAESRAAFIAGLFVRRRRTPTIAAVNGLAFGGGLELVLGCDIVVAAETATFALPEATRGFLASAGGVVRLPQAIGRSRAMRMALTGRPIDSETAERWGLVTERVPADRLRSHALALADEIAAAAPLAVEASMRIINAVSDDDEAAWELNDRMRATVGASEDAQEGPRAFAEKRPPVWRGR